jgi:hypothetical protein
MFKWSLILSPCQYFQPDSCRYDKTTEGFDSMSDAAKTNEQIWRDEVRRFDALLTVFPPGPRAGVLNALREADEFASLLRMIDRAEIYRTMYMMILAEVHGGLFLLRHRVEKIEKEFKEIKEQTNAGRGL